MNSPALSWKSDKPFVVSDALWAQIEPLLPAHPRRFRYPGRRRYPDRDCLNGVLEVLRLGIPWTALERREGMPSGQTCWRRMDEWTRAGVWDRVMALVVGQLDARGLLDTRRVLVDATTVAAKKGAPRRARARSIAASPPAKST